MMNKSLQILLGLLLILLLAYVAFLDVSSKIKDDLLRKTQVIFSEHNVRGVTANVQGEGSSISRSLVLTGTAISEVERVRVVTLMENIEGVCRVNNEIIIHPAVPTAPKVPTVIETPVVQTSSQSAMIKNTPKEAKNIAETIEEKKTSEIAAASSVVTAKVPDVPVVPTPVTAIAAPVVIEVEKIKLEGVK